MTQRPTMVSSPADRASKLAVEEIPPERKSTDVLEWQYGEVIDNGFRIAGIEPTGMPADHIRQVVDYSTTETAGTIIVETRQHRLYLVLGDGKAMRYAIGVGPNGRNFQGTAIIDRKAMWPRWIPTASMISRNPAKYALHANGVDGGISNPLGARAMYIQQDGIDTYYRVHGTNAPDSIGKSVSAGCIRLLNQDIIDLYGRVRIGSRIVVR